METNFISAYVTPLNTTQHALMWTVFYLQTFYGSFCI